jgi:UDP-2,4-diacetamido-2,4,6-trideoxy-beta-L-altropyranose hydrolase
MLQAMENVSSIIPRIHFRTEGNSVIGYGHIMRCIALAHYFPKAEIHFYGAGDYSEVLRQHCPQAIFRKLERSEDLYDAVSPEEIVVVDGYDFPENYYLKIKKAGAKLVCIDDPAENFMPADLVINPTPGIRGEDYSSFLFTQFCTGPDHALLRPAFIAAAQTETEKRPGSLLICFGGSDPKNITETALRAALDSAAFSEINVVLGPGYIHEINLPEDRQIVSFHRNLGEKEMAALMSVCETAILPCSGILLEGLAAGMKIISGYYVENQLKVYANHLKLGTFSDAGSFTYDSILAAVSHGAQLANKPVDGRSPERLRRAFSQLSEEKNYTIRRAQLSDSALTLQWANAPETRKFSFSTQQISQADHEQWFSRKLSSESCFYLIMELKGAAVGSIRFDIADGIATISYLAAPRHHGIGIGTILLKKGLQSLAGAFGSDDIHTVQGLVIEGNEASLKAFRRFGFREELKSANFVFSKKFIPYVQD